MLPRSPRDRGCDQATSGMRLEGRDRSRGADASASKGLLEDDPSGLGDTDGHRAAADDASVGGPTVMANEAVLLATATLESVWEALATTTTLRLFLAEESWVPGAMHTIRARPRARTATVAPPDI